MISTMHVVRQKQYNMFFKAGALVNKDSWTELAFHLILIQYLTAVIFFSELNVT